LDFFLLSSFVYERVFSLNNPHSSVFLSTNKKLLKMVLLTMIARVSDGLPLAASMQEDEEVKDVFLCGSLKMLASCSMHLAYDKTCF